MWTGQFTLITQNMWTRHALHTHTCTVYLSLQAWAMSRIESQKSPTHTFKNIIDEVFMSTFRDVFFWDQSFQSLIFFLPVINCWLLIGRFVQGRYQIQSLTFVLWRCCVVGTVHSGVQSCLFYVEEPGTVYSNDPFAWPPNPIGCPHEMTEDPGKKEPKTKQTQKQLNLQQQTKASWKAEKECTIQIKVIRTASEIHEAPWTFSVDTRVVLGGY